MFDDPDDEELDLINEQDSEGSDSDESDEINKSQPDVFKVTKLFYFGSFPIFISA